jgi:hypothetical protein
MGTNEYIKIYIMNRLCEIRGGWWCFLADDPNRPRFK